MERAESWKRRGQRGLGLTRDTGQVLAGGGGPKLQNELQKVRVTQCHEPPSGVLPTPWCSPGPSLLAHEPCGDAGRSPQCYLRENCSMAPGFGFITCKPGRRQAHLPPGRLMIIKAANACERL